MSTDFGAGVRLERAEPVATIVIDNPGKRNAVDRGRHGAAAREGVAANESATT